MPAGRNEITLRATCGRTIASTTVTVFVDDDFGQPGPTLTVTPDQTGWHVANGSTAKLSDEIEISNAGTGDMTWSVQGAAPWLTLSKKSRKMPDTLTVTADPSGLNSNSSYGVQLTITAAAADGSEQKAIVPVSLSIGGVWDPPAEVESKLFLPVTFTP